MLRGIATTLGLVSRDEVDLRGFPLGLYLRQGMIARGESVPEFKAPNHCRIVAATEKEKADA